MTVVVCDTSPLNYLVLCGVIDVLPALFGEIIAPPAVLTELRSRDAPPGVRIWSEALPAWLKIQAAKQLDSSLKLDPGEREAICLALEIRADLVLIDERAGRAAAKERGLIVVGTLGVLDKAAAKDLVDLPATIDRLARTTFKVDPALIKIVLERDAVRRKRP